jgi:hypothetical protein
MYNDYFGRKFNIQFFAGDGGGGSGGSGDSVPDDSKPKPKSEADPTPKKDLLYSQAEVDRMVKDRLDRERKKYEGFDELKAKAQKLDEIEAKKLQESGEYEKLMAQKDELHKAELEKLAAKIAELEASAKAQEVRKLKLEALKAAKIPDDKITDDVLDRIRGDDANAIKEDVAKFVKLIPSITTTDGGGNPLTGDKNKSNPPSKSAIEQVAEDAKYRADMNAVQSKLFGEN